VKAKPAASAQIQGTFSGILEPAAGRTVWKGTFTDASPCVDETGANTLGAFVFSSEQALVY
jgi:hypothetical protein